MAKRITAYILCIYILSGNIILPLGDFALMKDLPGMYHSYEKLVSQDEKGALDFIGDYLLGGRDFLGHNKNDAPENTKSPIQFQHIANFCSIVIVPERLNAIAIKEYHITHYDIPVLSALSEFHEELLRPPLT